jgi:hypothetical protein
LRKVSRSRPFTNPIPLSFTPPPSPPPKIGGIVATWRAQDEKAAADKRIADTKAEKESRTVAATKKADKMNAAGEVILWKSVAEIDENLVAVGNAGSKKKTALVAQIDARTAREFEYPFKFTKGLPKGRTTGIVSEVAHLKDIVERMIGRDVEIGRDLTAALPDGAADPHFHRTGVAPSSPLRSKQSKELAAADKAREAAAAAQDDPELLALEAKYKGKKFTDTDADREPAPKKGKGKAKARSASGQRCVVHAISWSAEQDDWVAECVLLDQSDEIPASSKTPGGLLLHQKIVYYVPSSIDSMLD